MEKKIRNLIKEVLSGFGIEAKDFVVEHPADLSMGDYSTNVAMVYIKHLKNLPIGGPKEFAQQIVLEINKKLPKEIKKIEVAGPGFINFYLSQEFFHKTIKEILTDARWGSNELFINKKVMVEYTDPNPFKPFHIGHLMTNAIGESIARILEFSGAEIIRANYQGDIGMHVAKAIWGLLEKGKPEDYLSVIEKANYIGECYVLGSKVYEENVSNKKEIDVINKKLYEKNDLEINELYNWGRKITLEAFEEIYQILDTKFKYYFFESEMAPIGMKIVKENIGKVFEESKGVIVFHAEKYNPKLHTRVFVNSQGLPTYETKEIGLIVTKFEKENLNLSVTITAVEQAEYMKVVQKAFSLIKPDYESRMKHITHGMMRFAEGKMSSRKGNVITGESLLNDTKELVYKKIIERDFSDEEKKLISSQIAVAALKYSILRQDLNGNIVYDFEKSISFEGDSGPYLQYTAVRANAILSKTEKEEINLSESPVKWETINLEKLLYRFPEVVARAYKNFAPHYIATYLIELGSLFNSFYATEKIIDKNDLNSPYKIALTKAFQKTMKSGLYLLGIQVPKKM